MLALIFKYKIVNIANMEKLTKTVGIRLTESEYALLEKRSLDEGRKIADVARVILRKGMATN